MKTDPELKRFALRCALCIALFFHLQISISAPTSEPYVDKIEVNSLQLLEWLQNKQYNDLDTYFHNIDNIYRKDVSKEYLLRFSYLAIANNDPGHEIQLNEWVTTKPNSIYALLARGIYYKKLGWEWRGTDYFNSTSQRRIYNMSRAHQLAITDLNGVIEIDKNQIMAYSEMMDIYIANCDMDNINELMAAGLKISPYSFSIRSSYLWAMTPAWCGNKTELMIFSESISKDIIHNKNLTALSKKHLMVEAHNLAKNGEYEDAIRIADTVVDSSVGLMRYDARGHIYMSHIGDHENAIKDFTKSLTIFPYNAGTLRERAYSYYKLGQYEQALKDIELAVKLQPYAAHINSTYSSILFEMGDYEKGIERYKRTFYFNGESDFGYNYIAWNIEHKMKNKIMAIEYYKKALSIDPNNVASNFSLGVLLFELDDCDCLPPLKKFVLLCATNDHYQDCRKSNITWSKQVVSRFVSQLVDCDNGMRPRVLVGLQDYVALAKKFVVGNVSYYAEYLQAHLESHWNDLMLIIDVLRNSPYRH